MVTSGEDTDWEGTAQSLPRGAESVLYLDLGSGYTDVYMYKNSSSFIFEIPVLYVM